MADTMNTRRTKRKDICEPQDRALAINGQNIRNIQNIKQDRESDKTGHEPTKTEIRSDSVVFAIAKETAHLILFGPAHARH